MSYNVFLRRWHGISQQLVLVNEKCFQDSLIFVINATELPKLLYSRGKLLDVLSNIVLNLIIFMF
jgi:hypothetical protein